jgi:hypothetical protein
MDPDLHKRENLDQDLHQSQNSTATEAQNGTMVGHGRSQQRRRVHVD